MTYYQHCWHCSPACTEPSDFQRNPKEAHTVPCDLCKESEGPGIHPYP